MGDVTAGIAVLGVLFVLAIASRWGRPKDRIRAEQDERAAIERQGAILADQAKLREARTPQEIADEVNRSFGK